MKKTLIIFTAFISVNCNSVELIIDHPCQNAPILTSTSEISSNEETIFSLTKELIQDNKIKADLGDNGIRSILDYVGENKSLQKINTHIFRAYGWCYTINGEIPDVMPDQIKIKNKDSIKWFLSYSTYDNDRWVDYCVPVTSNIDSKKFICE